MIGGGRTASRTVEEQVARGLDVDDFAPAPTKSKVMADHINCARIRVSLKERSWKHCRTFGICTRKRQPLNACQVVLLPTAGERCAHRKCGVTKVLAEDLRLSQARTMTTLRAGAVHSSSAAPARRDHPTTEGAGL